MTGLPLVAPGVAAALVVGLLCCRPVGRWLGVRPAVAWMLLFNLGVILAGTLSPLVAVPGSPHGGGVCDFARMWPASLDDVLHGPDVAINVAMFIPAGIAIGIAPRSRRQAALLAGVVVLSPIVEIVQLVVVPLDRSCQAADVADNLTGLAIGLVLGALIGRLVPRARLRRDA